MGTNSRLDAIQAAILRVKLRHLDGCTAAGRRNAMRYTELLCRMPEVELPAVGQGNFRVYNQFTVQTDQRDGLGRHLADAGIGTGVYYADPLHLQKCFADLGLGP